MTKDEVKITNREKLLKELEEVASLAKLVNSDNLKVSPFINRGYFVIQGEDDIRKYLSLVDSFCKEVPDISKQTLESDVIEPLINKFIQDSALEVTDISQPLNNFLKTPKTEFEVFRPLFGASLESEDFITLGKFTIYNTQSYQREISQKSNEDHKYLFEFIINNSDDEQLYIKTKVSAKEFNKVQEIADLDFQLFESSIRYMLGIQPIRRRKDIGIFDYMGTLNENLIAISSKGNLSYNQSNKGVLKLTAIDHNYFNSKGNAEIWKLLGNFNNKLQNRILTAIDWLGKAVRDIESARQFTQIIIALETLLQHQEKGGLVTPGVANTIAESTAFILGETVQTRKDIEKEVKHLYSKRSSIAHGGSNVVSIEEINRAFTLVESLINKLLLDPQLSNLKNMNNLIIWIKDRKYS